MFLKQPTYNNVDGILIGVFMSNENGDFSPEELAEFESQSEVPTSPEESSEPKEAKTEAEKIQDAIEELELKVNGKVIKEKINWNDKESLKKQIQMAKAAQEAFQERSSYKKNLEQAYEEQEKFLELLKSNPLSILGNKDLGLNLEELAEKILQSKIEEEMKSPEQLELEKMKKELEELQAEKKRVEEEKTQAEMARLEKEAAIQLENEISEAIEKGQLPKSPYITQKVAFIASRFYDNGLDVDMSEIIPIVNKMYINDMRDMLGKLPDEAVEDLVSQERVRAIRNKRIQAAKNSQKVAENKVTEISKEPVKKSQEKRMNPREFFKTLGTDGF